MEQKGYKAVQCTRGREWILRISTGQDVYDGIQQFAKDNNIRFAQIHTAFMGGFEPARMLIWTPDSTDPDNWHHETPMDIQNLTMLLSMGGFIHLRENEEGKEEPFPAIHYIVGAAWNAPIWGGHLVQGTIAKGNMEVFITEILGIDPIMEDNVNIGAPENWYIESNSSIK